LFCLIQTIARFWDTPLSFFAPQPHTLKQLSDKVSVTADAPEGLASKR
jgi:hypothetical protein